MFSSTKTKTMTKINICKKNEIKMIANISRLYTLCLKKSYHL